MSIEDSLVMGFSSIISPQALLQLHDIRHIQTGAVDVRTLRKD